MLFCNEVKSYPCALDYSLYSIPSLCLLANGFGMIRTYISMREITFEIFVLFFGVLESIAFILYKTLLSDICILLQECIQQSISLLIIFKFSRIILSLKGKLYQKMTLAIFITFLTINLSYYIVLLINEWFEFITLSSLLFVLASLGGVIISFCLMIFGLYLMNAIRTSLEHAFEIGNMEMGIGIESNGDDEHMINNANVNPNSKSNELEVKKSISRQFSLLKRASRKYDHREIYYATRLKQIQINITVALISDSMQFVMCLLENYVMKDHFAKIGHALMPETVYGCIVIICDELCSICFTFSYFFIFYFIVKRAYSNKGKSVVKAIITPSDLVIFKNEGEDRDIQKYMSFSYAGKDNHIKSADNTIDDINIKGNLVE